MYGGLFNSIGLRKAEQIPDQARNGPAYFFGTLHDAVYSRALDILSDSGKRHKFAEVFFDSARTY